MDNIYAKRIKALRDIMEDNGWEAVIIGGSDPHASEYPAPRWQQVKWLTGFTGEAADVVITSSHAGLWTDSRYFIQAETQLEGTGVVLHKTRIPGAVGIPEWLVTEAKVVAVDGLCQSVSFIEELQHVLGEGARIVDVPDMMSMLWYDRPWIPATPVTTLDVECFGGVPRQEKISWLRKWMLLNGVDRILLSSLDEIAWMLNVRGNDIDYNPLVISYLLLSQDSVKWFVRKNVLSEEQDPDTEDSFSELAAEGVDVEDYDMLMDALSDCASQERIYLDPSSLNSHVFNHIRALCQEDDVITGKSPVILQKAVKSPSEIEHLRQTFIEDGLALPPLCRIILPHVKDQPSYSLMDCILLILADSILPELRISPVRYLWGNAHILKKKTILLC